MRRSRLRHSLVSAIALGALAVWMPCAHAAELEPVTLPGTGDSQDLLRDLARGYTAQYPDRRVIVPDSIGSDGGIRVVGTGESPIGRVARQPNADEVTRYGKLAYVEFARVPVVFVVNPAAGVHELSAQQICDIFKGRITNWKDVGGNDLPTEVQARPDGSNLQTIRKNVPCFATLEVTRGAHFNLHNADLVASMKTFPGAIGFMPLSEAMVHGYRALTYDAVAPTMPHYPLGIGLGFVHKAALTAGIQAFLDYLQTGPAREIMRRAGVLPVDR